MIFYDYLIFGGRCNLEIILFFNTLNFRFWFFTTILNKEIKRQVDAIFEIPGNYPGDVVLTYFNIPSRT